MSLIDFNVLSGSTTTGEGIFRLTCLFLVLVLMEERWVALLMLDCCVFEVEGTGEGLLMVADFGR